MPLDSRNKQRSVVLDPAWFGQRDRRVDRPVSGVQPCSVRAARGGDAAMSAHNCFQCGVLGG
eukprot:1164217-Prymnesium_polylepis.1